MAAIPPSYGALRLHLRNHLVRDQWTAIVELLPTRPGRAQVEKWASALNLLDWMEGARAADGLPLLSETRLGRLIELLQDDAVGATDAAVVVRAFAAARGAAVASSAASSSSHSSAGSFASSSSAASPAAAAASGSGSTDYSASHGSWAMSAPTSSGKQLHDRRA